MDFGSINTVITSLASARELAVAAVGLRDFNQSAAAISKINEQLLAAQQGLLTHNTMLLQLQNNYFEATQELRELKESIAKKGSYPLVEIGNGALAYLVDGEACGESDPEVAQPKHHLCQICWDRDGVRSVLQPRPVNSGHLWRVCNVCGVVLTVGPARSGNSAASLTRAVDGHPA